MKALMVHSEDSAVAQYRTIQPAKYLRQLGWDIPELPYKLPVIPNDDEFIKPGDKLGSWASLSKNADIIMMQRSDTPDAIALGLAMREQSGCPLVYEIDDNIYDVSKTSPSYKYWFPGSPLIEVAETFMQHVDAITTTTEALADVYRRFNPNVYVLPNYQDLDTWEGVVRPKPENQIVVGWAGGFTHYDDLRLIRRVIKKILRNYKNVVFRVIGTLPDFLVGVEGVEFRKDSVHCTKWPNKLAELNFDIGLAPVVDRPFNQGKSNIKWQEYSMLGIPTIASNVGSYREIVPNETGFLANTESDWYFYLERLIKSEELRKEIGSNARKHITQNYSLAGNVSKWDQAYREIIQSFSATQVIPANATN